MAEQSDQIEKKGFGGVLRRALKGVWFVASALILPIDIKFREKKKIAFNHLKTAIFAFTYFIAQPAATFLFPTAEKVLEKQGLRAELVDELADGKKIFVREDNFFGNLHTMMDKPLLWLPFNESYWNENVRGYGWPDKSCLGISCPAIYLKDFDLLLINQEDRAYVHDESKGKAAVDADTHFPSLEESRKRVLLHELRHCSGQNMSLSNVFAKESDADYHAIRILARELNKPEFIQSSINMNAYFMKIETHDNALYLDAMFNKKTVPSVDEMQAANKEALAVYDSLRTKHLAGLYGYCDSQPQESWCSYELPADMSPLARQRAELFDYAMKDLFVRVPVKKDTVVSVPALKPAS